MINCVYLWITPCFTWKISCVVTVSGILPVDFGRLDLPSFMEMTLSKISKRVIASFVDYFLFALAYAFVLLSFGHEETMDNGQRTIELEGWLNIIPVILWIVTFPVMESFEGKTLGKKIMKLQVVKINGTAYSLLDSSKRRLCDWIDFSFLGLVGFLIASNSSLRQRLGDLWAGTVIVDVPLLSNESDDQATGL